jgi:hypothetical protein
MKSMKKLTTAIFILSTCYLSAVSQSVTMYTTGFEAGDVIPTYNATTGTMTTSTSSPYQGTKEGNLLAASSAIDGSYITPIQSFVAGCTYTVSFYCQVFGATTCNLIIAKSATATNVAMKAATGTDIIMASTTINWGSYQRLSASFTVLSGESKYIGLQVQGTGASVQFFADTWIVTRNCDHCSNGIQDADETGVDCGGADCPNASPVAGTISPTSASIACQGSQTLTLTGSTGDIQWQYSNDNSTWYDVSGKTSSTYAITNITSTTYYRAKVTYGGCTPTPVYSGTCTITSTGMSTKTWNGSSSTAWGTNANWTPSGVPTACNNVVIPNVANQPSIASNINAFCNDLTINSGATLTVNCGGAKVFEVSGSITNNGTINHASTKLMHFIGMNKTLSGNFTNSNNLIEMDACSYRLSGDVKIWQLTIDNNATPGCVSIGSNTLTIADKLTQNGLIYQETGTLQIEDPQAVLSQGNFMYGTGTTYFAKGENSTAGGQWIVGPFTFYNLKTRNFSGAVCHIGNNQGTITCHNFDIVNTGGSSFGGWVHLDNPLVVTNNLTIGAWSDLDAQEESANASINVTVGGNITNNGRYEQRKNTTTLNGTSDQYIGGTTTTSFYNLTLSKTSGKVILNTNVIVGSDDPQPVKSAPYVVLATDLNGVLTMSATEIDLNGYTLTFANPNTTAYTRTSGFIVSETNAAVNSSIVKWQMGTTTGAHDYPFGTASGASNYIPFTFNKTTAGSCDISVATRATSGSDNTPFAGASNVAAASTCPGAAADVIDRWWDITPSAAVTANLTFSYKGAENTCTNPTDVFGAGHWNGSSWDTPLGGNAGVTSGVGTVSASGASSFSPWVLTKYNGSSLPVELVSFNARKAEEGIVTEWTTASEVNSDHFTVERSEDSKNFAPVGNVEAAGNSNIRNQYSLVDANAPAKELYYRLKQFDLDGKSHYPGKIVNVNNQNPGALQLISPIPNDGQSFTLNFSACDDKEALARIVDDMGKVVWQQFFDLRTYGDNRLISVNTGQRFAPGIYTVRVTCLSGQQTKRFMVARKEE